MIADASARSRRWRRLPAVALLPVVLTACTGRGGGQLPPDARFTDAASFGFTFSCEDSSALHGPPGRLRIQLSYTDHGSSVGFEPFTVHGTADTLDPVLESAVCSGQDAPPGGSELIFLGRYWPTSSSSDGFGECGAPDTTADACRFEVVVQDEDQNRAPSPGDHFSITLSGVTEVSEPCVDEDGDTATCFVTEFTESQVLYSRAGVVAKGNLTVD